jgi:hypothetical protein
VKRLSLLAIAAVAALALTAAIGSATASATVLCKSGISPCPSSEVLPAGSYSTYGKVGGFNDYYLSMKTPFGGNFHCGYVGFGEKSLAEKETVLQASGGRELNSCGYGSSNVCSISMSNSTDYLTGAGTVGTINTGTIILKADCEGALDCNWQGSYKATTTKNSEGEFVQTAEGKFRFTSGYSVLICGEEPTLTTVPLSIADTRPAGYIVGSP